MPALDETLRVAEELLRVTWGGPVDLDRDAETLSVHERPTVVRARVVSGPRDVSSVIVKTYRGPKRYVPSEPGGPASGLFAEWAGLAFLGERLLGERPVAKLYAGDRDRGVIVLEDFGRGALLDEVLDGDDADAARDSMMQLAHALAAVHAGSLGEAAAYLEVRERLGPVRPPRAWLERVWGWGMQTLEHLGVSVAPAERVLLDGVWAAVVEPGRWEGLCQAEPGDGNVLVQDGRVRLLDFEGSTWGNVLIDAAFPRTAFGHLASSGRLPDPVVAEFEETYFRDLSVARGRAGDEGPEAIAAGCVWLAMECLGMYFKLTFDESRAPYGGQRGRAQLAHQWQRAGELGGTAAQLAERVVGRLCDQWKVADAPELPIFAAFTSSDG